MKKKKNTVPPCIEDNQSSESIGQQSICLNLQVTQHFFHYVNSIFYEFCKYKDNGKDKNLGTLQFGRVICCLKIFFKDLYSSANLFSQYNASLTSNWPHFSYSRKSGMQSLKYKYFDDSPSLQNEVQLHYLKLRTCLSFYS